MPKAKGNARKRRNRRGKAESIDKFLSDTGAVMAGDFSKIRPKGRAPRGLGAEYAARRDIARIMDRASGRASNAAYQRSQYRGTRAGRNTETRRSSTQDAMNRFRRNADSVLRGATSWRQKQRQIRDLYEVAQWEARGPYN